MLLRMYNARGCVLPKLFKVADLRGGFASYPTCIGDDGLEALYGVLHALNHLISGLE
jgi:hypothetical protein